MKRLIVRSTLLKVVTSLVLSPIIFDPNVVFASNLSQAEIVRDRKITIKPGGVHIAFSDEDISNLKRRITVNAEVAEQWNKIKTEADNQIDLTAKQILKDPRKLTEGLEPLVLTWRMTGDNKYAKKLYEILVLFSQQTNLVTDAPLLKRDPVWNSDLGMGFSGEIFGIIYDSIRETLTPAQRLELTSAYLEKLAQPVFSDWIDGRERIHTLDTMGHNWWAHIVFGTGVGLVAISRDDPRALPLVARIETAGVEWWNFQGSKIESRIPTFDSDGGNMESVNYSELAVGTYLEFYLAWKAVYKEKPVEIQKLEKAAEFLIHNSYPNSEKLIHVNFGDSNMYKNYSRTIANLWLSGRKRDDYLWYITQSASAGTGVDLRYKPRYLVSLPLKTEKNGSGKAPEMPLHAWYKGMGWATLRSSWLNDATFLAVRSGFTWNHSHADAGSFVVYHKGKPLIIDSGNSGYGRAEYDAYYRQTQAHNVVTFNGKAEPTEDTYIGSHNSGSIPNFLDAAGFRYIFADATGPTSANFARNFRHFLWVDGVILVYDDLKAREPGQFAFQIHTEGESKRQGQNLVVKNGNASLNIRPLFPTTFPDAGLPSDYPENIRLKELQGYKDRAPDIRTTYYSFEPFEKTERQKFLTAIIPQEEGNQPIIQRLIGQDMIGVRIQKEDKLTDVYINLKADGSIKHRNANTQLLGWDTDAYMLAITYKIGAVPSPATIERMMIVNGSYLRYKDNLLIDSLSKRLLVAEYGVNSKFWVQGQEAAELGIGLPKLGKTIVVNDKSLVLNSESKFVRVKCCN